MYFESHFKLESNYGKPFAAFPKPGGESYLVWYTDDKSNVYAVEVWSMSSSEVAQKGVQSPKPVLVVEQPSQGTRRLTP